MAEIDKPRPAVWIHARQKDDPTQGFNPEFCERVEKHFDIICHKDLVANPILGANIVGALVRGSRMYLENTLDLLPNLKIIANNGVGVDHIDVKKYNQLGVKVANTPDVLCDSVADMAVTLMLASARNLIPGVKLAMGSEPVQELNQNWLGNDVCFATLGIVGMGGIGFKIAQRAKAFQMNIYYHNRKRRSTAEESTVGASYCASLEELLPKCDYLIIACPQTPETVGMFSEARFKQMKPSATIINVARGKIIDQEALYTALKNKTIKAAALDVTYPEPLPRDHPLLTLPNIIISPHTGSATVETRRKMEMLMLENVLAEVEGRPLPSEVKG
ncbi:uncharacterized protein LOC106163656 [Lingula anatina]|uniref:Glyoxylate reductase/hydroxypyruvate reductase n=1 Tax=Lingula anatina TaxID=7574 RepID=A0A1S3IH11_LINAN|nr:uncharacterized protein LOC106163656 [Lingula anatina]|eukprot:XP_013396769.1 uncharacterized protein LOC106163656 [Lingula anatina]